MARKVVREEVAPRCKHYFGCVVGFHSRARFCASAIWTGVIRLHCQAPHQRWLLCRVKRETRNAQSKIDSDLPFDRKRLQRERSM